MAIIIQDTKITSPTKLDLDHVIGISLVLGLDRREGGGQRTVRTDHLGVRDKILYKTTELTMHLQPAII